MPVRGLVPARLLPPAPAEVERLLRLVEEALHGSGLRTTRESLSSVVGVESDADVGLVAEETLHASRPRRRVPAVVVGGRTDEIDERVREAVRRAGGLAYNRFAGEAWVEAWRPEVDEQARREAALREER